MSRDLAKRINLCEKTHGMKNYLFKLQFKHSNFVNEMKLQMMTKIKTMLTLMMVGWLNLTLKPKI